MRKPLLAALGASLVPSALCATGNVLVIVADDLGKDWLGLYGLSADPPSTPNLDALAASGVVFTNAWANPLCSPTRAAIQTGRYGFRTGIGGLVDNSQALAQSEVTLPEMLDLGTAGAYSHAYFGKWHLGNAGVGGALSPNLAGWDHFSGNAASAGSLVPGEDYFHFTKVVDGASIVVDGYATSDLVDDALAWIAATEVGGGPWLACTAFQAVHDPFHAPPPELHGVDLSAAGPPATDPVPYFRAMVEALDTEIGRLLSGIDLGETTVIFLADNGTDDRVVLAPFDPDHAKNSLYQGGVGVPFVVAGQAVAAAGTSAGLVHAADIFATVAELAGVDLGAVLPPGLVLDSVSFAPYLADPALSSVRSTLFSERFTPNGPVSGPLAPAVFGTYCQPDLGFAGPGTALISVCGDPLISGTSAGLALTGAPPFAPSFLAAGIVAGALPIAGGTMVPFPPAVLVPVLADGLGQWELAGIYGAVPGPYSLYVQMAVLDAAELEGVALTNAVRVDFGGWNAKAIRDERYKLIADTHVGFTRFFDLDQDPLELADLLADGTLTAEEEARYDSLRQALDTLITSP